MSNYETNPVGALQVDPCDRNDLDDDHIGVTPLGKGADNQNGNLRWHLPGRGGGVSRGSRLPLSYFEK